MSHADLKKAALDAIENLFGDTSVSKTRTLKDMTEIRETVCNNIDLIVADLEASEEDEPEEEDEE